MNDWKTGLKLVKYAYGIKINCLQALFFLLAGLVYAIAGESGNFGLIGGIFWLCIGMLPTQLIYTLAVANLVQASPMRRKVQTIFPVAGNLASMTVVYLAELVVCGILIGGKPEQAGEICHGLVLLASMMAIMMIYLGICYKYFVVATLCMFPIIIIWMGGILEDWLYTRAFFGQDISFWSAAAIGFAFLAAGGLAEYLLTLLLYRAPLSKLAQAAPLRKFLT